MTNIFHSKKFYSNKALEIYKFDSQNKQNKFLIIPSLINGPDLFYIDYTNSFVKALQQYAEVYVIHWQDANKYNLQFNIDSYVVELSSIIKKLQLNNLNVIGHCLGGNIALGVSFLLPNHINSLALLSTPWNFTYLQPFRKFLEFTKLDQLIECYHEVPALYLEMLFFLLQPQPVVQPLRSTAQQSAINRWLHSGNNLAKPVYNQIMHDFISKNICHHKKWLINERVIDPEYIDIPVFVLNGIKDKIVTLDSRISLNNEKSNYSFVEINSGHISFLIGKSRKDFYHKFFTWFLNTKKEEYARSIYSCG